MSLALTNDSKLTLAKALELATTATVVYLERPTDRIRAELEFEQQQGKLEVKIAMASQRHTMRLQAGDPANAWHLREQLEAIANGKADTAETGAIGTPTANPQLCTADRNLIVLTSQKGGHAELAMGATITVHRPNQTARTAIGVHQGETWLTSGSVNDVISGLRESLQQRLSA